MCDVRTIYGGSKHCNFPNNSFEYYNMRHNLYKQTLCVCVDRVCVCVCVMLEFVCYHANINKANIGRNTPPGIGTVVEHVLNYVATTILLIERVLH